MSNIRYALEEDLNAVRDLWKYSFADDESFVSYYFGKRYSPNYNLIAYEDDLLASLQKNPYKIKIMNDLQDTAYIVGISVYPEHRGKKLTTHLIDKALHEAYDLEEKISLLMPIDTNIYRRYGYENCFNLYSYEIDLSSIKFTKNKTLSLDRIRQMTDEYANDLIKIYNEKASNWNIYLERDLSYYYRFFDEVRIESGEIFIARNEEMKPIGYMVFYPKFQTNKGFVRELFCTDSRAIDSFMMLISSHATQIKSVEIHQPINSDLLYYFNYDNKIRINLKPFMMARIVDAKYILGKVAAKTNINRVIQIQDNILENNNKSFQIQGEKVIETTIEPDLVIDIGSLTQLYMGEVTIDQAVYLNKINANAEVIKDLNQLFKKRISYINEYI